MEIKLKNYDYYDIICCISPLSVSEITPVEFAGPLGGINQFMWTVGIMVASILGFVVPNSYAEGSGTTVNSEVYTTQSWRGIFIVPAIIAIIHSLLLLFVFRNDTLKYYKQKNNVEGVKRVEKLIYKEALEVVSPEVQNEGIQPNQENIEGQIEDEENKNNNQSSKEESNEVEKKVSFRELFTARYRKSFIVAWIFAFFQQLTGIMVVIFYSNEVFTQGSTGYNAEKLAKIGTMMVGIINCFSSLIAIPLLTKFGRKTLLIFGQIGMGASLLLLAVFALLNESIAIEVFTMCFITFFELSIGSIMFLYIAEITTEVGVSVATFIVWTMIVIFGLFTVDLFKTLTAAGVYFALAAFSMLGLIFIILMVKETKGKTKKRNWGAILYWASASWIKVNRKIK